MPAKTYDERKEQTARRARKKSEAARDIGPLPRIRNRRRRDRCKFDLKRFCETYLPLWFDMGWSPAHLTLIKVLEDAILNGGQAAVAMPRSFGKTTLTRAAAMWAVLYGHRRYVVLVGATTPLATKLLDNIITSFETNQKLADDFPHALQPIRALEHQSKRVQGQLLDGKPTRMSWTKTEFTMPTVRYSACSGSRLVCAGIDSAIRGLIEVLPSGEQIRPDLVIVDDPQTHSSAKSQADTESRLAIIRGDLMGLSAPRVELTMVIPCTVIRRGDVSDQLLDSSKFPEFRIIRTKMLEREPDEKALWDKYAELRLTSLQLHGNIGLATTHYRNNLVAMRRGAVVSWADRFIAGKEIDGLQHAMNLKLKDEVVFAAEYQNDPLTLDATNIIVLTPGQIMKKVVEGYAQAIIPSAAEKITAFIDVQDSLLYFGVCGIGKEMGCHLADYGAYPDQASLYFFLRDASPNLRTMQPKLTVAGQVRAGLDALSRRLLTRQYLTDRGLPRMIDRLLVDAGDNTATVKTWYAELPPELRARVMLSKGIGLGPQHTPLEDWRTFDVTKGDRRGWGWLYRPTVGLILVDVNRYKAMILERLNMAPGEVGTFSIFKGSEQRHKLLINHVLSEEPKSLSNDANGRRVTVFVRKPNQENHVEDCIVGCLAAASEQGIIATGHQIQQGLVLRPARRYHIRQ